MATMRVNANTSSGRKSGTDPYTDGDALGEGVGDLGPKCYIEFFRSSELLPLISFSNDERRSCSNALRKWLESIFEFSLRA